MTPLHVAIIPDGNRRWAKANTLFPWKGHEKGAENFDALVEWCRADGRVGTLTFWCFSTENWKRDPKEVAELMRILEGYLHAKREKLQANKIHLARSGRTDRIAPHLLQLIEEIDKETAADPKMTLHVALDYGGQDEVVRAVQKLSSPNEASVDSIRAQLDHPELADIDLVIRTSGEQRTSNFFLWQSTYAEWMFAPEFFPDFGPEKLAAAVNSFSARQRRFGA